MAMNGDWRGGFLFVGNHLALDFLNTRPVIDGVAVEMLADGGALANWLAAADLVSKTRAGRLRREWQAAPVNELTELREKLRKAAVLMEGGDRAPSGFVATVNALLQKYPYVDQIVADEGGFKNVKHFDPVEPAEAQGPLADAIAKLLTKTEPGRMRQCANCALHFYDTSKKGTRQWCSMRMCGNRAKVAAFAERRRTDAASVRKPRRRGLQ